MKLRLGFLLPLAFVAAGAFVAPAHATMLSATPSARSPLVAQSRRAQTPLASDSYIGIGGSNDGAVVNGKYALTNHIAVRPEILTNARNNNDDRGTAVLVPLTYDFNTGVNQRLHPFLGAGPGVTTGNQTNVQLATTAGADYKLGNRYTADASVNYLPFDDSRTDFVAGVGYNF